MNDPSRPASLPRTPWQELKGRLLRLLRGLLIMYAVVGVVGSVASLLIARAPAFDDSGTSSSADFDEDVANSWNRFNADDATAGPSWTLDQVKAAAGDARGGHIVTLRGSQSVIDATQVEKALAGTRYVVVLTPPTPLGASETTRLRDNTAQQSWADQQGISLVLVHGQQVVIPYGKLNRTIIFDIPAAGLPQREAMRTGDVTATVLSVIDSALGRDADGADDPGTPAAASVALTNTRAPTTVELSPVTKALDAGPFYVDPSVSDPPSFHTGWSALATGGHVKVVLLPFAKSGTAVDWTDALAARYPNTAILVMTGKWIESAGIDRERVLAALWQTYAVGEFALASSPPAYAQILDWVTGVAGIARAAAEQHTSLPAAAPGGIPRWLSYLILGTSLLIAAAFGVQQLWQRRRTRRPGGSTRGEWRDSLLTTMTTCYLQVGQAADLAFDDGVRARTRSALDVADSALQALRAMPRDPLAADDRHQQRNAAREAWFALEEAAEIVGRPDLRPGTLSPGLQPDPADEPSSPSLLRRRKRIAGVRTKRPFRWLTWVVVVALLGFGASTVFGTVIRGGGIGSTAAGPTALRTSNVSGLDGTQRSGVEQAIADRALLLVYDDRRDAAFDTADAVSAAYPNAVVFVIENGKVGSTGIGTDVAVRGYDEFSLIKDYYPVQFAAGTDPVAQARQLVLLYDRLTAEGSIRGAVRATFDGPERPWVLIVIVVVLALIAAALIIRFGVGAASRRLEAGTEGRALRESLSLRLAGAQQDWLEHGTADSRDQQRAADWAQRARALQERIATAGPADVTPLIAQIDALRAETTRG